MKNPDDMNEEEKRKRAELELLIGQGKTGSQAEFKPNARDKRF